LRLHPVNGPAHCSNVSPPESALGPLDCVISGYAYETATNAIGVIEEGKSTKRWFGTEALCTLDNLIKVFLLNDRVFITGCADLKDNYFIPRNAEYQADKSRLAKLDQSNVFQPAPPSHSDGAAVEARITEIISPVDVGASPLFIITCDFPKQKITLLQELVYLDVFFIEYAIEQFGAAHFKPVFPGEHLYLGIRSRRAPVPHVANTVSDLPPRRLRTAIRSKMKEINELVSQGAPMLPELPPIFVSGVLHNCKKGEDFIPALIDLRESKPMRALREWAKKCWELAQSTDLSQRTKAAEALKKLNQYSPDADMGKLEFGVAVFEILKNAFAANPIGILEKIVPHVAKLFLEAPFKGLQQFAGKKVDPEQFNSFLKETFGDRFNRGEMDFISYHLQLPENLAEWETAEANLSVSPGRLDAAAPPLGRAFNMKTAFGPLVDNATKDSQAAFDEAVPFQLIMELLNNGIPQEKIDALMEKPNANQELEKLRQQIKPAS
jgi:hypothetical protein